MKLKTECAVCRTKIWEYRKSALMGKTKLVRTPEYNEIDVRLNDLSKMTVGVCSKHLKPKKLELQMMTEKTHQGWLEEVHLGIGDEDWVKDIGMKLKIVGIQ